MSATIPHPTWQPATDDPPFFAEWTNGQHLTRLTVDADGTPMLAVETEIGPLRQVCQRGDRAYLIWLMTTARDALRAMDGGER